MQKLTGLTDGRQSDTALRTMRGTQRLLRGLGFTSLPEMILPDGRRADLVALAPDGTLSIIEVKSSVADFRTDQKWENYLTYCDRFFFAITADMPQDLIPLHAGLIVADNYDAAILRHPNLTKRLSGPTRRAMLLRFAHAAAGRLHKIHDPDLDRS